MGGGFGRAERIEVSGALGGATPDGNTIAPIGDRLAQPVHHGSMYEAGLRVGEALALKSRDVVIEEKRVEVLRGKGSKPRTVYFRSDELGILIERWKEKRYESTGTGPPAPAFYMMTAAHYRGTLIQDY